MRKWKDDGSHIIKPFQRKIYLIIGGLIMARPVITYYITGTIDVMDVINFFLGALMIWGVRFNGFYKLAKMYAEWNLKRKDNRFDYYSK